MIGAIFNRTIKWFYLDPDNRKAPPRDENGNIKAHCCRCMKPFRQQIGVGMRTVTVHPIHPWVTNDPLGKQLIGLDCWEVVIKNPVPEAEL